MFHVCNAHYYIRFCAHGFDLPSLEQKATGPLARTSLFLMDTGEAEFNALCFFGGSLRNCERTNNSACRTVPSAD